GAEKRLLIIPKGRLFFFLRHFLFPARHQKSLPIIFYIFMQGFAVIEQGILHITHYFKAFLN
ncbi:MAG: hypothetical protein MR410_07210, partial [Eubacterium sp.]|nr:hypothetical protein [Eubacterium sp.]